MMTLILAEAVDYMSMMSEYLSLHGIRLCTLQFIWVIWMYHLNLDPLKVILKYIAVLVISFWRRFSTESIYSDVC